ncbi:MAG: MCE family protein [Ignavibacteriales bacterium]|nr:MCE family protein [Ignavibacteriales bacterium]
MNEDKKTEIQVGVTIFIALIIFGLVFGWAKNYSFSSNNFPLTVDFNTVAGLENGDLVSVNGVRKGFVKSITSNANAARVEIVFDEDPNLKEDATFSIMMLDLMGGKKVEISRGASNSDLDYSKIHLGNFSGDISTVMATLNSVETDLISVIKDLKKSLDFVSINFTNDDFSSNVNQSLNNVKSLTANLNELILVNKNNISETIKNANQLTSTTNELILENKEQIKYLISTVNSTMNNADILIKKIDLLAGETIDGKNNIGKLLYDENLFIQLKESLEQINKLTNTINKQLENGGLEVKADVDLF